MEKEEMEKQKTKVVTKSAIRFSNFFTKIKVLANKVLFPDDIKCCFCGVDIPNFDERPYCDRCAKTLPFNVGHKCVICDQPIESEAIVCDFCQKEKRYFKKAFCPFLYEGAVKKTILAFKDNNQRYRAKAFAKIISNCLSDIKIDFVTYIPMTDKKQKKRSFNQSQLLAEEIAKILQKPVYSCFEKRRDLKAQKNLTYRQRREALVGTYTLKQVKLKKTDNVLLVDDVITTCATVGYCSGLLYPKVNNIYVCAIARETFKGKNERKDL